MALAEAGADIVLAQRPAPAGQAATNLETHDAILAAGRRVEVVTCDLADLSDDGEASVKKCFDKAVEVAKRWDKGGVDILVNCGGIQRRYPAVEFPEAEWDTVSCPQVVSVWRLSTSDSVGPDRFLT